MVLKNIHTNCDKLPLSVHQEFERRMDDANRRQNERIDRLEHTYQQLTEINVSVRTMAENVSVMSEMLSKTSDRLEKLEDSAITNAQLNGFGTRLDTLEKFANEKIEGIDGAVNAKLSELASSTAEKFEEMEKRRWQELENRQAMAKERRETVIKTVLGIVVTVLVYAVIRALLPNIIL